MACRSNQVALSVPFRSHHGVLVFLHGLLQRSWVIPETNYAINWGRDHLWSLALQYVSLEVLTSQLILVSPDFPSAPWLALLTWGSSSWIFALSICLGTCQRPTNILSPLVYRLVSICCGKRETYPATKQFLTGFQETVYNYKYKLASTTWGCVGTEG